MDNTKITNLSPMVYRWGVIENKKWTEKGRLFITKEGVLLNEEKLANPTYQAISQGLAFGGKHGTFARTGRFSFDQSQLYFNGTMEMDDGATEHIIGFAAYDFTFETTIVPNSGSEDAEKAGPQLEIKINLQAYDQLINRSVVTYSLIDGKKQKNISNRVSPSNRNTVKQVFELKMGKGAAFPPTHDLFDIEMKTDMSKFEGTYQSGSRSTDKFLWSGELIPANAAELRRDIQEAEGKLMQAEIKKIKNTAYKLRLANIEASAISEPNEADEKDGPTILPGLDAQDLAFLNAMNEKGMNMETLESIRGVRSETDEKGNSVINDVAQKNAAHYINTATLQSMQSPWKEDFKLKPKPLSNGAHKVLKENEPFFVDNANLQMGTLLKYKQSTFSGVDFEAIKTIDQSKLDATWKLKSMKPERLDGYMKATNDMYACAYTDFNAEFEAYTLEDKEKWGRAYFHWLTEPTQISSWQNQFMTLTPDQVTVLIYDWHAKLSILAPLKSYAAEMSAYALALFMTSQAVGVKWVKDSLPFLTEIFAGSADANATVKSATGEEIGNLQSEFVKERISQLNTAIGAEEMASAISEAALAYQDPNTDEPFYEYIYENPDSLGYIAKQLSPEFKNSFNDWISSFPTGNDDTTPTANVVLSFCIYSASAVGLLTVLAPKSKSKENSLSPYAKIDVSPEVAWLLKGLKIAQIAITCIAGPIFGGIFAKGVSNLWSSFISDGSQEAPELVEALSAISTAVEDGESVTSWVLAFGTGISKFFKIAGPVFALVGIGISIFNIVKDVGDNNVRDIVFDAFSLLVGVIGGTLATLVLSGLVTGAAAGPIGLAIAIIGAVIFALKWIFDELFPSPTPIQIFVSEPLTQLGVVTA